jgi:hypothetical protein
MIALLIVVLLPCVIDAQQSGQAGVKPMTLTALDYFEIQQLVAKYARAIDTCSNYGYDYADLFTADGFFAPFHTARSAQSFRGGSGWPRHRAAAHAAVRTSGGSSRA